MSSFVFYRFKSQKEPSRISFDGLSIGVWDLKKEIIHDAKMGKGADFDFAIYNQDTEEEYHDRESVPRSTTVIARRLPPSKPGRGNAAQYMATSGDEPVIGRNGQAIAPASNQRDDHRGGQGGGGWNNQGMSRRFDGHGGDGFAGPPAPVNESAPVVAPAGASGDEASAMAAMFAASSEQWNQTQQQMATATPIHRAPMRPPPRTAPPPSGGAPGSAPTPGGPILSGPPRPPGGGGHDHGPSTQHKPPPPGYICYRCGQKGHWIQDCPTNNDRAWDDRPRIKRTTGIPKSFLTEVEGPGTEGGPAGMMVTAEGGFVVARPDNASWLAHRAITKNLSATDVQNLAPTDPDLTCPICSKLLRDATLTPCCSTSFCDDCINNALVDGEMMCPECESRVKSLEKLKVDEGRRERVKKYIEEAVQASKEVEEEEGGEGEGEKKEGEEAVEEKKQSEVEAKKAEGDEKVVKREEGTPAPVKDGSAPPPASASATPAPANPTSPPNPAQAQLNQPPAQTNNANNFDPNAGNAMNPAQQQQLLRQQQLRQQQQMMQMQAAQMGLPSPQMLQAQMYQLSMALQNPQLPPPMRMQMAQQLQQCQMMVMQMGMGGNMGMGMAQGVMNGGMGGQGMQQGQGMGMGGMMGQQQQRMGQQGQQPLMRAAGPMQVAPPRGPGGGGNVPTGPKAGVAPVGAPTGPKRAREASPEGPNKRAGSPGVVAK